MAGQEKRARTTWLGVHILLRACSPLKAFRNANEMATCEGLAYYVCLAQLLDTCLFVAKLTHNFVRVLTEPLRPVPGLKR